MPVLLRDKPKTRMYQAVAAKDHGGVAKSPFDNQALCIQGGFPQLIWGMRGLAFEKTKFR